MLITNWQQQQQGWHLASYMALERGPLAKSPVKPKMTSTIPCRYIHSEFWVTHHPKISICFTMRPITNQKTPDDVHTRTFLQIPGKSPRLMFFFSSCIERGSLPCLLASAIDCSPGSMYCHENETVTKIWKWIPGMCPISSSSKSSSRSCTW